MALIPMERGHVLLGDPSARHLLRSTTKYYGVHTRDHILLVLELETVGLFRSICCEANYGMQPDMPRRPLI